MDGLENLACLLVDYIKLDCRMSVSKATVFFLCVCVCLCSHSHQSVLSVFVKDGPSMFVSFSHSLISVRQKTCLTLALIVQAVKKK